MPISWSTQSINVDILMKEPVAENIRNYLPLIQTKGCMNTVSIRLFFLLPIPKPQCFFLNLILTELN